MTATIHESPVQVKQAPAAIAVSGLVDLADGHAFVRTAGYRRGPDDIYISAAQIRQYGLRKGDLIEGTARSQPVTVERPAGAYTVIAQGVRPGDEVVTDGQVRLVNGAPVEVKGSADPARAMEGDK